MGFQPFLTDAQTTLGGVSPMIQAAATRTGQLHMSPYQSQVIDATLAQFDEQARAIQEQSIRDQQAALGALGAGRTGVQLAEFGKGLIEKHYYKHN